MAAERKIQNHDFTVSTDTHGGSPDPYAGGDRRIHAAFFQDSPWVFPEKIHQKISGKDLPAVGMAGQIQIHARHGCLFQFSGLMIHDQNRKGMIQIFCQPGKGQPAVPFLERLVRILPADEIKTVVNEQNLIFQKTDICQIKKPEKIRIFRKRFTGRKGKAGQDPLADVVISAAGENSVSAFQ